MWVATAAVVAMYSKLGVAGRSCAPMVPSSPISTASTLVPPKSTPIRNTGRSNPLEDVTVQPTPIERFSGVGLAPWSDFGMPNDPTEGQSRVAPHQTHGDVCESTVLCGLVRDRIRP